MEIRRRQGLKVVLASKSSVRQRMLAAAGVEFQIQPARLDETALLERMDASTSMAERAATLAEAKAIAVEAAGEHDGAAVIGADQILCFQERAYEAPRSTAEAEARLKMLRGSVHHLIAAVAVVRNGAVIGSAHETVAVEMRPISDEELVVYMEQAGDEALSAVGAYALEGLGARLMRRIEGDWFAALGMPLWPLLGMLDMLQRRIDAPGTAQP